jgi:cob(I)alamin adenosyltransferase
MLYTRSGDAGTTALFGGGRVPKDSPRVEAYGCVDELNSAIGVAASFIDDPSLAGVLAGIQTISTSARSCQRSSGQKAAEAGRMFIDDRKIAIRSAHRRPDARVEPLRTFILPSGGHAGAMLHLCRTVCRRAERAAVTLARDERVNPAVMTYLNRLSDLLFALARYANKAEGREETLWQKG